MTGYNLATNNKPYPAEWWNDVIHGSVIHFASRTSRDATIPVAASRPDRMLTYLEDERVVEVWFSAGATWVPMGLPVNVPVVRSSSYTVTATTTADNSTIALASTLPTSGKAYRVTAELGFSGSVGAACVIGLACTGATGFVAAGHGPGITGFDITTVSSRISLTATTGRAGALLSGRVVSPSDNAVINLHVLGLTGGLLDLVAGSSLTIERSV